MPTRILVLCAATLLACTLPVAPASAEDGVWKVGTGYVIRFEKLDLSNPFDRQVLLAQVEKTTERVCEGERTEARRNACADETLRSIKNSLEPGLRASLDVARFERDGVQQAQR